MVAYSNLSSLVEESNSEISPPNHQIVENLTVAETVLPLEIKRKFAGQIIRSSLRASTWDGVFAAIFSSITSGVLLSNFLLQLGASTVEIGILSSIPMLVNLLQPVGAYLASLTTSRYWYGMWIFGPARLLWLILVLGIWLISPNDTNKHNLLQWTLAIVLASNILSALGGASWFSWVAALVPHRLRGRYFGIRNSAASLANLICIPLMGLAVSAWPGGTIQGYGVTLAIGVGLGLISLKFQSQMADVNPQEQCRHREMTGSAQKGERLPQISDSSKPSSSLFDPNFGRFLLYFGLWTFAVNVSNPFFNLYLLDNLDIDVKWVTLYNSLTSGANLLMLVGWGKLADRIGNRPILLLVGILVAVTPIFWLGTDADIFSLWLWLPLLHLLQGGTWAAIDLCNHNIQMQVAPIRHQATYFAIAGAVGGVGGALATICGGFLAQFADVGGLPGLFVLSSVLRLLALLPLVFVQEYPSQPLSLVIKSIKNICIAPKLAFPAKVQLAPVPVLVQKETKTQP
ncbi:MAG TPA: MFS transporter [Leptolyngbyaceae cyanobacterium]